MVMSRKIATRRMTAFVAWASLRPSLIWPLADSSMRTEQNGDIARLEGAGRCSLGHRGHHLPCHPRPQAPPEEGQPGHKRGKVERAGRQVRAWRGAGGMRAAGGARGDGPSSLRALLSRGAHLRHGRRQDAPHPGSPLLDEQGERQSEVERRGAGEVVPVGRAAARARCGRTTGSGSR